MLLAGPKPQRSQNFGTPNTIPDPKYVRHSGVAGWDILWKMNEPALPEHDDQPLHPNDPKVLPQERKDLLLVLAIQRYPGFADPHPDLALPQPDVVFKTLIQSADSLARLKHSEINRFIDDAAKNYLFPAIESLSAVPQSPDRNELLYWIVNQPSIVFSSLMSSSPPPTSDAIRKHYISFACRPYTIPSRFWLDRPQWLKQPFIVRYSMEQAVQQKQLWNPQDIAQVYQDKVTLFALADRKEVPSKGSIRFAAKLQFPTDENRIMGGLALLPPQVVRMSSRLEREWGDRLLFVYPEVGFKKSPENKEDMETALASLCAWDIHEDAALYVAGRKYRRLLFKPEQGSNDTLVYFAVQGVDIKPISVEYVWSALGDFSKDTHPGKIVSRLGLALSPCEPTLDFAKQPDIRVETIDDISSVSTGQVMTDGCGTISADLLESVCAIAGITDQVSALQIRSTSRYGGFKGLLVLDINPQAPKRTIRVTKSMMKYSKPFEPMKAETLDVCGYNRPKHREPYTGIRETKLQYISRANTQVILLLIGNSPHPDQLLSVLKDLVTECELFNQSANRSAELRSIQRRLWADVANMLSPTASVDDDDDETLQRLADMLNQENVVDSLAINFDNMSIISNNNNMERKEDKEEMEEKQQQQRGPSRAISNPYEKGANGANGCGRDLRQAIEEEQQTAQIEEQEDHPAGKSLAVLQMLLAGVDISKEQWAANIYRQLTSSTVDKLAETLRIPIPGSQWLEAVPDFQGLLEEGEVYIKLGATTITGPVVLTRNPCHHPCDMRILKAVPEPSPDYDKLSSIAVFSVKGACSALSQMSGGDYDGDMVWVCWNRRVVDLLEQVPFTPENHPKAPAVKSQSNGGIVGNQSALSVPSQQQLQPQPQQPQQRRVGQPQLIRQQLSQQQEEQQQQQPSKQSMQMLDNLLSMDQSAVSVRRMLHLVKTALDCLPEHLTDCWLGKLSILHQNLANHPNFGLKHELTQRVALLCGEAVDAFKHGGFNVQAAKQAYFFQAPPGTRARVQKDREPGWFRGTVLDSLRQHVLGLREQQEKQKNAVDQNAAIEEVKPLVQFSSLKADFRNKAQYEKEAREAYAQFRQKWHTKCKNPTQHFTDLRREARRLFLQPFSQEPCVKALGVAVLLRDECWLQVPKAVQEQMQSTLLVP